jgi:hypothetical protein
MGARTKVTLDEDVFERVKAESRIRGASFSDTVNDLLRVVFADPARHRRPPLVLQPFHMGSNPDLNYDDIESLIAYAEGEDHR